MVLQRFQYSGFFRKDRCETQQTEFTIPFPNFEKKGYSYSHSKGKIENATFLAVRSKILTDIEDFNQVLSKTVIER